MFGSFILRSSIDKGQKGVLKFNQTGILDSVEFKILNLNHKYEWKQVIIKINCQERLCDNSCINKGGLMEQQANKHR